MRYVCFCITRSAERKNDDVSLVQLLPRAPESKRVRAVLFVFWDDDDDDDDSDDENTRDFTRRCDCGFQQERERTREGNDDIIIAGR